MMTKIAEIRTLILSLKVPLDRSILLFVAPSPFAIPQFTKPSSGRRFYAKKIASVFKRREKPKGDNGLRPARSST